MSDHKSSVSNEDESGVRHSHLKAHLGNSIQVESQEGQQGFADGTVVVCDSLH